MRTHEGCVHIRGTSKRLTVWCGPTFEQGFDDHRPAFYIKDILSHSYKTWPSSSCPAVVVVFAVVLVVITIIISPVIDYTVCDNILWHIIMICSVRGGFLLILLLFICFLSTSKRPGAASGLTSWPRGRAGNGAVQAVRTKNVEIGFNYSWARGFRNPACGKGI